MSTKARTVVVSAQWCKACGICIEFCPRKVFTAEPLTGLARVERSDDCSGCRLCELLCPDYAISIEDEEAEIEETRVE